ncbi:MULTISPECIES: hypothetical protein [Bacillaceae]|uniref:Uncharacterized protein n=1 Tax=Oceanobacillus caeni TaxID=405946 RepID=A0ABR5MIM0_9BACI|nr:MULTISPECIES: hypothetical protein [Bacillaceae]KPH74466.1 hypothetical protein AFL42_10090 [Oceanobacillus caeni]MED4473687.1 hypothetical protein [Oceanobacillus caeni]
MKQAIYGLVLYLFLMLPPVITLSESIMVVHMHMQIPLLVIVGMLFTPYLKDRFPNVFENWNYNGIPGIMLFMIIVIYWMIPRAMDEALAISTIEIFKFISLPFLAGIPLRDSWSKLNTLGKNIIFICLILISSAMAWLYIAIPTQICNNYLIVEQKALGWTFLLIGLCLFIYFVQSLFIKDYSLEESENE